ncbi:MAG: recombinase family protein [Planctomycetota bacterium]|jgi:site-specific DNA recombinase
MNDTSTTVADVKLRAAGYVRVSQERNARNGWGLGAQESDVARYVQFKRWKPAEVYREEGVSGYDRERPALVRMLADAKAGKFDIVIFPSIDRAARSVKDMIDIDTILRRAGVDVIFVREGVDTSTPTGELYRNIIAAVAQWEGRIIYERMSKGKRKKASEGGYIGGWLPYGYQSENGQVVVIPEEAEVVRWVFRRRAKGISYRTIITQLEERGVRTAKDNNWQVSTLRGMIRNRFYAGRVDFEGELIRARHDAIVSDVLFEKANSPKGR